MSERPGSDTAVGLCRRCRHAAAQRSARGNTFWRCRRADEDATFLRYPPLPVVECAGFEEIVEPAGTPETRIS